MQNFDFFEFSGKCISHPSAFMLYAYAVWNKERRIWGGEIRKLSGFSKFWIVSWLGGDAVAF